LFEGVEWFWGLTCGFWAENAKNKCKGNGMRVSDDDGNGDSDTFGKGYGQHQISSAMKRTGDCGRAMREIMDE
jgi:hypothetical protein